MNRDIKEVEGQCHCGTVRFRAVLANGLHTARRCNCSFCRMRGAVAVSANYDKLRVVAGHEFLTLYQFNTRSAQHYFCSKCGIYTHHRRRSDQAQYGVNVACLTGISPFDFEKIPVYDGIHHVSDSKVGSAPAIAGILEYHSLSKL